MSCMLTRRHQQAHCLNCKSYVYKPHKQLQICHVAQTLTQTRLKDNMQILILECILFVSILWTCTQSAHSWSPPLLTDSRSAPPHLLSVSPSSLTLGHRPPHTPSIAASPGKGKRPPSEPKAAGASTGASDTILRRFCVARTFMCSAYFSSSMRS